MKISLESFTTEDGLKLPAILFEPERRSDKAALFLHGNGSSSVFYDADETNELGREVTNKGISYFPFNNRGAHYIKRFRIKKNGKEEKILYGTAFELIKECILDIDAAVDYLRKKGYKTFYLIGVSTGANKIVVYNYYKKVNPFSKYALLSGGDDTGLYYDAWGKQKFLDLLNRAERKIKEGKGRELVPYEEISYFLSYQSLYDIINPDGDYNVFPFNEYINSIKLSKKPLFEKYRLLDKPTLVLYGELDEYCYGNVPKCVGILKKECIHKDLFTFKILEGADHGFNGYEKEFARVISDWL